VALFILRLDEFGKLDTQRRDVRQRCWPLGEHLKILELESGSTGTPEEAILAERPCCLPTPSGDYAHRMSTWSACAEHLLMYDISTINPVDLQWISFIEVPGLIGRDPVPTPMLPLHEQK
jgi:hypothetical protein